MILLTGATGYIGSHMLLVLLQRRQRVVALDNLSNSSKEAFYRVCKLAKITDDANEVCFIKGDIRDRKILDHIFDQYPIDSVLHFAGLKAVGKSVEQPLKYFDNNINGSLTLMQAMQTAGVHKMVFSSSATVYGDSVSLPITENAPLNLPTNPYGYTKLAIEQMLMQWVAANSNIAIAALRYFNPIGAHKSGQIGEHPQGVPNNLLPYVSQVAAGKLARLSIWGDDYDTQDGTGVRDYIHVMDLVDGHLKALDYLSNHQGYHIWNLGTGQGYSVLEIVNAFENMTKTSVPYTIKPRRAGDIATCYADPSKAQNELNWQAQYKLEDMITDTWRWQQQNPDGYKSN